MPPDQFLHDHAEFSDLIRIVAEQRSIDPALAEKDYWIMHCLYGLQQLGMAFELKGGTSLSKGYGIIDRFSEDIDIRIEPPAYRDVKTGPNHRKSAHVESRTRMGRQAVKKDGALKPRQWQRTRLQRRLISDNGRDSDCRTSARERPWMRLCLRLL